jgi:hypothetical protein
MPRTRCHHVVPVLERALLALVEDLGRGHRADALDGFELGEGRLVDVDRGERGGGRQGQHDGDDFLQHGNLPERCFVMRDAPCIALSPL